MREIKFRAKERSGEWHVGSLFVEDGMGIPYIVSGVNTHYETNYSTVEVVPETVGQFTGLTDCKGQEIFEGDILFVKAENPYWSKFDSKHVVTWCNDGWILNDYGTDDPGLFHILMNNNCEIIGNVNDNPGLLEAHA